MKKKSEKIALKHHQYCLYMENHYYKNSKIFIFILLYFHISLVESKIPIYF